MTKVLNVAKRFVADEEGAALIEYTVLIGLMLVAVIAAIIAIGGWVSNKWTALNTALNG
jgi:pilus assembly protein Flp/PilA